VVGFSETLAALRLLGHMVDVDEEVDRDYEAPQVFLKAALRGSYAVSLKPRGSDMPLVSNVYWRKINEVVGRMDEIYEKVEDAFTVLRKLPRDSLQHLDVMTSLASLSGSLPRVAENSPLLSRIASGYDADLTSLPAIRHVAEEEAPVVVNPILMVYSPPRRELYVEACKAAVIDEKTLVVHVPRRSQLRSAIEEALRSKATLPAALVVGADPPLQLAATPPSPAGVNRLLLASLIGQERLAIVGLGDKLYVPAGAEIAVKGYIEPGDTLPEPRILSEDGSLRGGEPMPVLHVEKLYMRQEPVFYTSIMDPRSSDAAELMRAASTLARAYVHTIFPAVDDVYVPPEAAGRVVYASISPSERRRAREIGLGLLSLGLTPHVEAVILFSGVDLRDPHATLNAVWSNVDLERDVLELRGMPSSELFHREEEATRILVDATPKEQRPAPPPQAAEKAEEVLRRTGLFG